MVACELAWKVGILRRLNHKKILYPFINSFQQAFTECLRVLCWRLRVVQENWEKFFQRIPDFQQIELQWSSKDWGWGRRAEREIPKGTHYWKAKRIFQRFKMLREAVKQRERDPRSITEIKSFWWENLSVNPNLAKAASKLNIDSIDSSLSFF